jgi:hypothetical protein
VCVEEDDGHYRSRGSDDLANFDTNGTALT